VPQRVVDVLRLACRLRARHAVETMSERTLIALGAALLIAALTFFVSRKFGLTLLFLPLFFVGGASRKR
jgi:hypothetical protein